MLVRQRNHFACAVPSDVGRHKISQLVCLAKTVSLNGFDAITFARELNHLVSNCPSHSLISIGF
jgi:hypothetical protein